MDSMIDEDLNRGLGLMSPRRLVTLEEKSSYWDGGPDCRCEDETVYVSHITQKLTTVEIYPPNCKAT